MSEAVVLLDPTDEKTPIHQQRNPRPQSLEGLTIGLLDISKARGDVFLDEIDTHLQARNLTVKRYMKPTFARVAPPELEAQIAQECDVVIEALAD